MIRAKQTIVLGLFMSIASAFGNQKFYRFILPVIEVSKQEVVEFKAEIKTAEKIKVVNNNKTFLSSLGRRESGNRWDIVNKWGYYGKWQLSRANIRKFCGCTTKEYLKSPELQTKAMMGLLRHNKKNLRKQITKYSNTARHGVWVTESGMLAAAHLAGAGNVRKWLRNGKNPKDKLGTSLEDYMTLFGGYNLQIPN